MRIHLKNVRISYPDLFTPGKKYGKYGAEFRFSKESGLKDKIESAIDTEGTAFFGGDWAKVKKGLTLKAKLFRVKEGSEKDYTDDYFVTTTTGKSGTLKPKVANSDGSLLSENDNVIYPGARVDAWLDINVFKIGTDPIVSINLIAVQFRADDEPLSGSAPRVDFTPITDGSDAEDL